MELKETFKLHELKDAGFSAADLAGAGITTENLLVAGFHDEGPERRATLERLHIWGQPRA